MPLTKVAWLATVIACVIAAIALLLSEYVGYAIVVAAVGLSASINLR